MPESTNADDSSLVSRCLEGDPAAWEDLVRRYQRLVYAIARNAGLEEHTCADVFQTVFMRLIQHLPGIAEPARLQAWIVTTTKREAWLQRRHAARLLSMTQGEADDDNTYAIADTAPQPDETVAHWQQLAQVQLALERLDLRCRQLLQALFADEGNEYGELARRLGMAVGSIGPTRARCLTKLRRLIV